LETTGVDRIAAYLDELTEYLCERLKSKDYEMVSSRKAGERSAIVCIKHAGRLPSNEIAERLEQEKIIVSPRGERLRIAPHFYNNMVDIDRLVEALP
jgi:selenocysteine lyase/cysteine desulfurase